MEFPNLSSVFSAITDFNAGSAVEHGTAQALEEGIANALVHRKDELMNTVLRGRIGDFVFKVMDSTTPETRTAVASTLGAIITQHNLIPWPARVLFSAGLQGVSQGANRIFEEGITPEEKKRRFDDEWRTASEEAIGSRWCMNPRNVEGQIHILEGDNSLCGIEKKPAKRGFPHEVLRVGRHRGLCPICFPEASPKQVFEEHLINQNSKEPVMTDTATPKKGSGKSFVSLLPENKRDSYAFLCWWLNHWKDHDAVAEPSSIEKTDANEQQAIEAWVPGMWPGNADGFANKALTNLRKMQDDAPQELIDLLPEVPRAELVKDARKWLEPIIPLILNKYKGEVGDRTWDTIDRIFPVPDIIRNAKVVAQWFNRPWVFAIGIGLAVLAAMMLGVITVILVGTPTIMTIVSVGTFTASTLTLLIWPMIDTPWDTTAHWLSPNSPAILLILVVFSVLGIYLGRFIAPVLGNAGTWLANKLQGLNPQNQTGITAWAVRQLRTPEERKEAERQAEAMRLLREERQNSVHAPLTAMKRLGVTLTVVATVATVLMFLAVFTAPDWQAIACGLTLVSYLVIGVTVEMLSIVRSRIDDQNYLGKEARKMMRILSKWVLVPPIVALVAAFLLSHSVPYGKTWCATSENCSYYTGMSTGSPKTSVAGQPGKKSGICDLWGEDEVKPKGCE